MRPSSDSTYARLEEFLRELFRIVDAAIALAVGDSKRRKRPIDDSFLAAYVRDETKGRLKELKGTALECDVKLLNNGGVQAIFREMALRLRKQKNGSGLPKVQSKALQCYYEQLSLVWPGDEASPVSLNLVVLWEYDAESSSLGTLDLILPHQWRLSVPHPATEITPETLLDVSYDDVDIEFADGEVVADDDIDGDVTLENEEEKQKEDESDNDTQKKSGK